MNEKEIIRLEKIFSPTLATEKLKKTYGIQISDESVKKITLADGLWKHHCRR
jgi:hypothetical protein